MLCFILSMNAYATPVLIGGPTFHMMAPTVYQQVAKAMNWPFGAALAFVLMAVTLFLTTTANVLVQRHYRKWSELMGALAIRRIYAASPPPCSPSCCCRWSPSSG